jgi:hypothetical protein
VLYIPPSPDQPLKPVTIPSDLHTYPPHSPTSRRRFLFLPFRRRGSPPTEAEKSGKGREKKGEPSRPLTWEDNWEKGEYPFVQLDSHRASCAICLLDFQEPKRVGVGARRTVVDMTKPNEQEQPQEQVAENQATGGPEALEQEGDVTRQPTTPALPSGDISLRLQDAGEGAQPLRLLNCGHVFHVSCTYPQTNLVLTTTDGLPLRQKTCVDPWLLDVSGRCPVCQRPVRGNEPEGTIGTGQEARPARRRWFRRNRQRGT